MKVKSFNRRAFLQHSLTLAAGAPLAFRTNGLLAAGAVIVPDNSPASRPSNAKVAIVACKSYGPEVRAAMGKCFDLLGGIGSLVKNKTVTVKLNLTGTDFTPFLNRPVGETYMTHYATAFEQALKRRFLRVARRPTPPKPHQVRASRWRVVTKQRLERRLRHRIGNRRPASAPRSRIPPKRCLPVLPKQHLKPATRVRDHPARSALLVRIGPRPIHFVVHAGAGAAGCAVPVLHQECRLAGRIPAAQIVPARVIRTAVVALLASAQTAAAMDAGSPLAASAAARRRRACGSRSCSILWW